jgi:tetratricopeptide (TPR) repeat protein
LAKDLLQPDPVVATESQPTAEEFLKEEMEVAQQLVKEFPAEVSAYAELAIAHTGRGNAVEATRCWQRCLELNPRFAQAYQGLGMNALKKAEYEEAIGWWRKAVEIDPEMRGAHGGLGRALLYLGKPREAVVELEQDVRISPRESLGYFLLGQAYLQLDDCVKARANYEMAAQLQPDESRAYYGLATACEKLGESEKAKAHQEKFRQLKARESSDYYRDMKTYDDLGRLRERVVVAHAGAGQIYRRAGGLSKAEEHWRRASSLAPRNSAILRELASLFEDASREQDALEIRERLRAVEPGDANNLLNIGVGNARLHRFDAAVAAYRKVIEVAPGQSGGYRALSDLYLKTNQKLEEARTLAESAVRLEPSAANFRLLCEACDKNGDRQGALSAMERAVALEPKNEQYRRIYELLKSRK